MSPSTRGETKSPRSDQTQPRRANVLRCARSPSQQLHVVFDRYIRGESTGVSYSENAMG